MTEVVNKGHNAKPSAPLMIILRPIYASWIKICRVFVSAVSQRSALVCFLITMSLNSRSATLHLALTYLPIYCLDHIMFGFGCYLFKYAGM